MNDYDILRNILLILAVSIAIVYLLRKLHLPVIVGFIVAGVIIGPGGLNLIESRHDIELIAEIGVALLLFTIGLRFSFKELAQMKWLALGAGGAQLVATVAVTAFALNTFFKIEPRNALVIGILVTVSSTAIVFRLLEERGETYTVPGRLMVGVLIFQDLAVVPLILLIIFMGGGDTGSWMDASLTLVQAAFLLAALFTVSRFLFPWLMERVVRTGSSEVFTLTVILIALGTAYLGSRMGFSLAIGAFLAGIVISESEYSHQVLADITPFRDAFNSLFFVSIGMLVEPSLWLSDPSSTVGAAAAVIVLKAIIVAAVVLSFGFGGWVAAIAGLGLAQVGEFSFVLAHTGLTEGLLDNGIYAKFISLTVITMAFTPLIVNAAPALAARVPRGERILELMGGERGAARARFARSLGIEPVVGEEKEVSDHVVIVGYGLNGRNVARMLRRIGVRYIILELNPHTVRRVRREGQEIYYGDAVRKEVLRHAGVERARSLVVAVADPAQARQIVVTARSLNPDLNIIVRTRFMSEVEGLYRLGASQVVPEEFETSLELAGKVMAVYGAGSRIISEEKNAIRDDHYAPLSVSDSRHEKRRTLDTLILADDLRETVLEPGMAATGKRISETALRKKTGTTIVAVERGREMITNPPPYLRLEAGDTLFLLGNSSELEAAHALLTGVSS